MRLGPVLPDSPLLWVLGAVRMGVLNLRPDGIGAGHLFHRDRRLHYDGGVGLPPQAGLRAEFERWPTPRG